jgi:hypothetical protein
LFELHILKIIIYTNSFESLTLNHSSMAAICKKFTLEEIINKKGQNPFEYPLYGTDPTTGVEVMSRKLDEVSLPVTINDHLFNDFDRPQVIDGKVVTIRRPQSRDDGCVVQIEALTLVSLKLLRNPGHSLTPIVGCEIFAVTLPLPITVGGVKFTKTDYCVAKMVNDKSVSFDPLPDGKGCIVYIQELQEITLESICDSIIPGHLPIVNEEKRRVTFLVENIPPFPFKVNGVVFVDKRCLPVGDKRVSLSFDWEINAIGCTVCITEMPHHTIDGLYNLVVPAYLSDWTPLAGTETLPLKCELPLVLHDTVFAEYNVEQKVILGKPPLVVGGVMFAEYNVEQKVILGELPLVVGGVYSVSFKLPQPGQTGCVVNITSHHELM